MEHKCIRQQLVFGLDTSTPCSFATDAIFANWPRISGGQAESAVEGNHLAILAFVWACILSARWLELQQPKGAWVLDPARSDDWMCYFDVQAEWRCDGCSEESPQAPDDLDINIGDMDDEAGRWWAAILANGEGWRAEITRNGSLYALQAPRESWPSTFD